MTKNWIGRSAGISAMFAAGAAENLPVSLHRPSRQRGVADAVLNEHRQHVNGKGMSELMGADVDIETEGSASAGGTGEDDFPGVRPYRQADLREPQCRRFVRRAVAVADNDPTAFLGAEQVKCDIAAVKQSQPGSVPFPMNEDRSVDQLPSRAPLELRDGKSTFDIDIGAHLLEQPGGNENLTATIALGLGIRQIQPDLTARLLIRDSVEEKIRLLQQQKRELVSGVLGEEGFARNLSMDDLAFLFSQGNR